MGFQHFIQICRAARTFPSPTSNTLPRNKAKNLFQARLPSSARGRTPLCWSAREGRYVTVERLLAAGANIDSVDTVGRGLGAGRFYTNLSQFDLRTLSFLRVYCKHMFKVIEIAVGCGGKRKVKIVFAESTEVLRN